METTITEKLPMTLQIIKNTAQVQLIKHAANYTLWRNIIINIINIGVLNLARNWCVRHKNTSLSQACTESCKF